MTDQISQFLQQLDDCNAEIAILKEQNASLLAELERYRKSEREIRVYVKYNSKDSTWFINEHILWILDRASAEVARKEHEDENSND